MTDSTDGSAMINIWVSVISLHQYSL
jgi:hypothetical protein